MRFVLNCIESQEASPFPAGDHKAQINIQKGITNIRQKKTFKIHKRNTALERSVKHFTGGLKPVSRLIQMGIKAHRYLACMKYP